MSDDAARTISSLEARCAALTLALEALDQDAKEARMERDEAREKRDEFRRERNQLTVTLADERNRNRSDAADHAYAITRAEAVARNKTAEVKRLTEELAEAKAKVEGLADKWEQYHRDSDYEDRWDRGHAAAHSHLAAQLRAALGGAL